jgi:hypothetical protein
MDFNYTKMQALMVWAGLLEDRKYPPLSLVDPADQRIFSSFSLSLDVTNGIENASITYLGHLLADYCGVDPRSVGPQVLANSLLSQIKRHGADAIAAEAPFDFEDLGSDPFVLRGCVLPFSNDGTTIDQLHVILDLSFWEEAYGRSAGSLPPHDSPPNPAREQRRYEGPSGAVVHDADNVISIEATKNALAENRVDHPEVDPQDREPLTLDGQLDRARALSIAAKASEDRSHVTLYEAIASAYDFALAAAQSPSQFQELAERAGLKIQATRPLSAVVRLIFGAQYDKTRLAEYSAVLAHAIRSSLAPGSLSQFIQQADGGLKGIVQAERRLRRQESSKAVGGAKAPRSSVIRKLSALPVRELSSLDLECDQYGLAITHRLPNGEFVILGMVQDVPLLERAARKLVADNP